MIFVNKLIKLINGEKAKGEKLPPPTYRTINQEQKKNYNNWQRYIHNELFLTLKNK